MLATGNGAGTGASGALMTDAVFASRDFFPPPPSFFFFILRKAKAPDTLS